MNDILYSVMYECIYGNPEHAHIQFSHLESLFDLPSFVEDSLYISLSSSPIQIRQLSTVCLQKSLLKSINFEILNRNHSILVSNIFNCYQFSVPELIRRNFDIVFLMFLKNFEGIDEIYFQIITKFEVLAPEEIFPVLEILIVLLNILKQGEWEVEEKKFVLLFEKIFYLLGIHCEKILNLNFNAKFASLFNVFLIFWKLLENNPVTEQKSIEGIETWFNYIVVTIRLLGNFDSNAYSKEIKTQEEKLKYLCFKISFKLFCSYYDPFVLKAIPASISKLFFNNFHINILENCLNSLKDFEKNGNNAKFLIIIFKTLSVGVTLKQSFHYIQMNISEILFFVLPYLKLCLTDLENLNENVVDFITNEITLLESADSVRSACLNFISLLFDKNFTSNELNFVSNLIRSNDDLNKDIGLQIIGSILNVLSYNTDLNNAILSVLNTEMLQKFDSLPILLKFHLLWIVLKFSELGLNFQVFQETLLKCVGKELIGNSPPIKIMCAIILPKLADFRQSYFEIEKQSFNVFEIYLGILDNYNTDYVYEALFEFFETFSNFFVANSQIFSKTIAELFVRIVAREVFIHIVPNCLLEIGNKLIENVKDHTKVYQIGVNFEPVFTLIFSHRIVEFYDDCLNLFRTLLFHWENEETFNFYQYVNCISQYFVNEVCVTFEKKITVSIISQIICIFIQKFAKKIENPNFALDFFHKLLDQTHELLTCGIKVCFFLSKYYHLDKNHLEIVVNSLWKLIHDKTKKISLEFNEIMIISLSKYPESLFEIIKDKENFLTSLCKIFEVKSSYQNVSISELIISSLALVHILSRVSQYDSFSKSLFEWSLEHLNSHEKNESLINSVFSIEIRVPITFKITHTNFTIKTYSQSAKSHLMYFHNF